MKKKKLISLLLLASMTASLVGCGGSSGAGGVIRITAIPHSPLRQRQRRIRHQGRITHLRGR